MNTLFSGTLEVVNIGLSSFADSVNEAGGHSLHVDWIPPAEGDPALCRDLAELTGDPVIAEANQKAFEAYLRSAPKLKDVGRAKDVLPGMGDRMILHAGPPILFEEMCGPMQGAVVGAILFEGWATDQDEAMNLAGSGQIEFSPCHHHDTVGPMAGIVCPSMPMWIVHDEENNRYAFSSLNEGLGKVLRFGANSQEVLTRLAWMRDVMAPTLAKGLKVLGPIDLKPIMAQALHMGDEVHNRNAAASSLLFKRLVSGLLRAGLDSETIASTLEFIAGNDHFFLNISMAACKAMLDAAHGVPGSTMVTAMSRNGVEFGIRLSGAGDRWFTAPAPKVEGLYFPGFSVDDAACDLGDSAITETAGVGGFAMAASPAIVKFVGGTPQDALANTEKMTHITLGRNNAFTIPMLDFVGTPAGIDVYKVVDTGILPVINTGVAHGEAGIGQIGAGVTQAPLSCFTQALAFLAAQRRQAETA